MIEDDTTPSKTIARPKEEIIGKYIEDKEDIIHIFGEPGVGKTTVLNHVEEKFKDDVVLDRRNIQAHHGINELSRVVSLALFEALPQDKKEESRKLAGLSLTTPLGGGGVQSETREAEASRAKIGYRDSLLSLCKLYPDEERPDVQTLVICIDDVHELSDDERKIRGVIQEVADELPPNVVLITAGRISWEEIETAVSLFMFNEAQTITFLQRVSDITTNDAQEIHNQLGGHPLYLGLFAEVNNNQDLVDIPEFKIQQEIKNRYFKFLEPDERRFLLSTASLEELNRDICTSVASRTHGFDRVKVDQILSSLKNRTVVQTLDTNSDGLQVFKIHDVFRDFLQTRSDHNDIAQVGACVYHAEKLIDLVGDNRAFETEINHVTSWAAHLSRRSIYEETNIHTNLIKATIADDGLRFYPSSLLVDEFKKRDPTEVPDTIVTAILSSVDESRNIANHFYDADLDCSWAEYFYEQGEFTDPENNLISYVDRTAELRPSFVQRVVQELETDDFNKQRFYISVGRDLPADHAAVIGQRAVSWVQQDEAYGYLGTSALRLASYLIECGEYDVALDILDAILTPREGKQLDTEQGMLRYNLIELFNNHFDELVQERGPKLLEVFISNLIEALDQRTEDEPRFGAVPDRISFADLRYVENERGSLAEILMDYFVQSMTAWVSVNPTDEKQAEFVRWLLDQSSALRRGGLYTLSEFPKKFVEQINEEVTHEPNYREQQSQYEFYRCLEKGFEHLDDTAQQRVCELIDDGPYAEDVENRAEQLAARGEAPASYFEQRIRETWKRDRLYLIRDHIEDSYATQLEKLIQKHDEPDSLPSEGRQHRRMHGGVAQQEDPVETEELRNQPVKEVLITAVEGKPPDPDQWDTLEIEQFEEQNHVRFSRQLRQLIQEDPQRYAREISVLEDAHTRYAEAAFRAFRDLLDEDETFPWGSILALGQGITTSPTAWSERVRTDLAMLINRGISSDSTSFPEGDESQIEDILFTLVTDPDPKPEHDQPAEGMAGYGNPEQVAINSVRPMAVNAYITYLTWKDKQTKNQLDELFFAPVKKRICDDQSLAVRSVIGRRFGALCALNAQLIENHLDDIFPQETSQSARREFIAAWNSYTSYNRYRDKNNFREYYFHSLSLLDKDKDSRYQIKTQSTTRHVASIYLFEDEELSDDASLINRFYRLANQEETQELATTLSSSMGNEAVENRWDKIRELWDYRVDMLDPGEEDHNTEIWHFINCVRNATTTTLQKEQSRIIQSLPFVANHTVHWRRIEEWLAEQAADNPDVTITIYDELVGAVPCDEWSSIARTSQQKYRSSLYDSAEDSGEETLQTALDIADHFAAENNQMDEEFLKRHLPV